MDGLSSLHTSRRV